MTMKKYGIYSGRDYKINLTNSYLEAQSNFADDRGSIRLVSTHVHTNADLFSRNGGTVDSIFSHGTHQTKTPKTTSYQLTQLFFTEHGNLTPLANTKNGVKVQSSAVKQPAQLRSKLFYTDDFPVEKIGFVKVSFKYKVNSGGNSPDLRIRPRIRLYGKMEGKIFQIVNLLIQ